ncbi:MAG: hypothetical protein ACI9T7_001929, partial [Oleiphilaceae bacterium]
FLNYLFELVITQYFQCPWSSLKIRVELRHGPLLVIPKTLRGVDEAPRR